VKLFLTLTLPVEDDDDWCTVVAATLAVTPPYFTRSDSGSHDVL